MKKMISKWLVFSVFAGALVLTGGCNKNKSEAELWGDDNMIGDEFVGDGMMLPDSDGAPMDVDRSVVDPVYFAYDSSQVNPEEAGKCEEVAKLIKKGKYEGVVVEGHGDERGSREYNLGLGERRALAVRDYLISLGVDSSVIYTKTFGEEMPADMGHDEGAWRKNRRAEFGMY